MSNDQAKHGSLMLQNLTLDAVCEEIGRLSRELSALRAVRLALRKKAAWDAAAARDAAHATDAQEAGSE